MCTRKCRPSKAQRAAGLGVGMGVLIVTIRGRKLDGCGVTPSQRSRHQTVPPRCIVGAHLAVEGAAGAEQWLELMVQPAPQQVQLRRQLLLLRGVGHRGVFHLHSASRRGLVSGLGAFRQNGRAARRMPSSRPLPATAARPSLASRLNIMLWAAALVTGAWEGPKAPALVAATATVMALVLGGHSPTAGRVRWEGWNAKGVWAHAVLESEVDATVKVQQRAAPRVRCTGLRKCSRCALHSVSPSVGV